MAIKFLLTLAVLSVANAAVLVPSARLVKTAAPIAVAPAPVLTKTVELEEYDPHPQYKYGYDVEDTLSGDSKGHVEERDGDLVRGEYSLIDADGYRRTVSYTADSINGFNAVVRREPLVVAAPVVEAAPLVRAAPLVKAAPAAVVRSAPLVVAKPAAVVRTAPAQYVAAPLAYSAPFATTYIRNL